MNIYLIGYRGTGKTTVGKLLADMLGWQWIDSDQEIQQDAGRTIAEIFADDGEPLFRDLETAAVGRIAELQNYVVSLGGGAILRPENCELIRCSGKAIWLTADSETIANRLAADEATADQRPRLTDQSGIAEIESLLAARRELYRRAADLDVDTVKNSPAQVARKIADQVTAWLRDQEPSS